MKLTFRIPTFICLLFTVLLFISCQSNDPKQEDKQKQGQADQKAEVLASKIMEAMGGEQKWNDLKYISWTFFGSRKLVWDKIGERVRIENPRDTSVVVLNMKTMEGKYAKNGIEVKDTTILNAQLQKARSIWINDSYWLVMPFKLRDPGVNLIYSRLDTLSNGSPADVLELTFDDVGDTPENKYEVFVDQKDHLIKSWSFFKDASQEKPSRTWPWDNYQNFNGLLISTDRSDKSGPSEVKVYTEMDDRVFNTIVETTY